MLYMYFKVEKFTDLLFFKKYTLSNFVLKLLQITHRNVTVSLRIICLELVTCTVTQNVQLI